MDAREKVNAKQRRHYAKHNERMKIRNRVRRGRFLEKNPNYFRDASRKNRQLNNHKILKKLRDKYAALSDDEKKALREKAKTYYLKDKAGAFARVAKRRALKKGAEIGDQKAIREWVKKQKQRRSVRCFWCNKSTPTRAMHIDHITALKNGGRHALENLCVSCAPCNSKKGACKLSDWNQRIEQPILLIV